MLIFFSARYRETMVTYNTQLRFLKFVTLYSCTIELILEELKDIKWIWHQEIRTPYMLLWHYLHYWVSDTNQIHSTTSQYTSLCYWSFIFVQTRGWLIDIHVRKKKCHYFCTGVYTCIDILSPWSQIRSSNKRSQPTMEYQ